MHGKAGQQTTEPCATGKRLSRYFSTLDSLPTTHFLGCLKGTLGYILNVETEQIGSLFIELCASSHVNDATVFRCPGTKPRTSQLLPHELLNGKKQVQTINPILSHFRALLVLLLALPSHPLYSFSLEQWRLRACLPGIRYGQCPGTKPRTSQLLPHELLNGKKQVQTINPILSHICSFCTVASLSIHLLPYFPPRQPCT